MLRTLFRPRATLCSAIIAEDMNSNRCEPQSMPSTGDTFYEQRLLISL